MKPVHPHLPETRHDEQARQDFVRNLRGHLASSVSPRNETLWHEVVAPAFEAEHGRAPGHWSEIVPLMTAQPDYQFWSALQRCSQEMMWQSVIEPVERQWDHLVERARRISADRPAGGTLQLDPALTVPRYHTAFDIHLQPGGYHGEHVPDDVAAGAIYEAGLPIYIGGALGPLGDFLGRGLAQWARMAWPEFNPRRILDMGCAVGNCTLPWKTLYPEAEVHAIDVAAPCLRHAHARAESLGVAVHFSQQNAESTDFEDGAFDLVVSHIMLHETSHPALNNILAETRRLLAPGGRMLHLDIYRGKEPFEQFQYQWETFNNNEYFARAMTDIDLVALAEKAGFDPETTQMLGLSADFGQEQRNYASAGFAWPVLYGEGPT